MGAIPCNLLWHSQRKVCKINAFRHTAKALVGIDWGQQLPGLFYCTYLIGKATGGTKWIEESNGLRGSSAQWICRKIASIITDPMYCGLCAMVRCKTANIRILTKRCNWQESLCKCVLWALLIVLDWPSGVAAPGWNRYLLWVYSPLPELAEVSKGDSIDWEPVGWTRPW